MVVVFDVQNSVQVGYQQNHYSGSYFFFFENWKWQPTLNGHQLTIEQPVEQQYAVYTSFIGFRVVFVLNPPNQLFKW